VQNHETKLADDSYFPDALIGSFVRAGVLTWSDLEKIPADDIYHLAHLKFFHLEYIKEQLQQRELELRPCDPLLIVPESIRKKLHEAGINSSEIIYSMTENEVRARTGLGRSAMITLKERLHLFDKCFQKQMPVPPPNDIPEDLALIEQALAKKSVAEVANDFGFSATKIYRLRNKAFQARRQLEFSQAQYVKWKGEVGFES
jgi:hypothetical protein